MPIRPSHLKSTPLLLSRSFHLLSTPEEALQQVPSLMNLRRGARAKHSPLIIWEPRPSSCASESREAFFRAGKSVDIFSPNHIELARNSVSPAPEIVDRAVLEDFATRFIELGVGQQGLGAVVLEAGEEGCMVVSSNQPIRWIRAFYGTLGPCVESKVVDPTGAANAFSGSICYWLVGDQ